jgi:hypothetical protein
VVSRAPAGNEVIQVLSSFLERATESPRERQLEQWFSKKLHFGDAVSNFSPIDSCLLPDLYLEEMKKKSRSLRCLNGQCERETILGTRCSHNGLVRTSNPTRPTTHSS